MSGVIVLVPPVTAFEQEGRPPIRTLPVSDSEELADFVAEARRRFVSSVVANDALDRNDGLTCPQLLLTRLCSNPEDVAYRQKSKGCYQGWSWKKLSLEVARLHGALRDLGFQRGDRIALFGDPQVEMLALEMAALAAGGISANFYLSHSPTELQDLLAIIKPKLVVVDRQDQLVKVMDATSGIPEIGAIILLDGKMKFMYPQANVLDYGQVREKGVRLLATNSQPFFDDVAVGEVDDPALIFFTEFSTRPKAIVHSHGSFRASLRALLSLCPTLRRKPFRTLAVVPPAHMVGKLTVLLPLASKLVVHYPEQFENLREGLREVAPDFVFLPPRILQKLAAVLASDLHSISGLKKLAYRTALWSATKAQKPQGGVLARAANLLARLFVFQPLLDKVGLARVSYALTGGAVAPADVVALWRSWGVDLREVYLGPDFGIGLAQQLDRRSSSLGSSVAGAETEIRVLDSGELVIRGPAVAAGDWQAGEFIRRPKDWHRTGDLVEAQAAEFQLIGREGRFAKLAGGTLINQEKVAGLLKGSAFISEAIVVGEGHPSPCAVIELDLDIAGHWARSLGIPYTSTVNLIQRPELQDKIAAEINNVNERLDAHERICGFRILSEELDPHLGVITPARTVIYSKASEAFAELIAEVYRDKKNAAAHGG
jgi:long-chain acyl-CoA synthetase